MKITKPSLIMRCYAQMYGPIRTAGPMSMVAFNGTVLTQAHRDEPISYTPLQARTLANYLYELADKAEGHVYIERAVFGLKPSAN